MKRLCLSNQFFTLSILFLGLCLTPSLIAQQGKALSLDGDGDYIVVQNSNTLFTNVPFTVETWFNMETIASDWYTVIGNDEYEIHLDWNSRISVWDNGAGTLTGYQTIESNRWYHVAFVNDGQSRRIYLNGLLDVEANDAGALKDDVQQLWIGNDPAPPNRHFNRLVDEVRVWNIARSEEEIRNNINQHLTGAEDGLVGYWNFDQGVAMDASGNDNHGALHGDASIVEADFPHSPIAIQNNIDIGSLLVGESRSASVTIQNASSQELQIHLAKNYKFRMLRQRLQSNRLHCLSPLGLRQTLLLLLLLQTQDKFQDKFWSKPTDYLPLR